MKQIIFLFTLAVFMITQTTAFAQRGDGRSPERWGKYKAEKVSFLTTNLDLSPEEAQRFWPLYNQLDKEKAELQMKRKDLEQNVRDAEETISDDEIIKLTREFASSHEKEGALNKKYNEEFLKVLPPKKVLQLYKVEGEFRMYLFKKYRDQHKKEGSKHP